MISAQPAMRPLVNKPTGHDLGITISPSKRIKTKETKAPLQLHKYAKTEFGLGHCASVFGSSDRASSRARYLFALSHDPFSDARCYNNST